MSGASDGKIAEMPYCRFFKERELFPKRTGPPENYDSRVEPQHEEECAKLRDSFCRPAYSFLGCSMEFGCNEQPNQGMQRRVSARDVMQRHEHVFEDRA